MFRKCCEAAMSNKRCSVIGHSLTTTEKGSPLETALSVARWVYRIVCGIIIACVQHLTLSEEDLVEARIPGSTRMKERLFLFIMDCTKCF